MLTLKRLAWLKAGAPPRNVTEAALSAKLGGGGAAYEKTVGPSPIVSVTDAKRKPALSLIAGMEPVQDLHGYENPWPAGGGKNLVHVTAVTQTLNDVTLTVASDGSMVVNGTANGATTFEIGRAAIADTSVDWVFAGNPTGASSSTWRSMLSFYDGNDTYLSTIYINSVSKKINAEDIPSGATYAIVYFIMLSGKSLSNSKYLPRMIPYSERTDSWVPYSNICPITGHTGLTAYRTGINLLGGNALRDAVKTSMPSATDHPDDRYIQFSVGATVADFISKAAGITFKQNTQYTFILSLYKTSGIGSNLKVYYTDGTNDDIPDLSAANTKETIVFTSDSGKTINYFSKSGMSGSTRVYYDECGIFEGVLTASDFEEYRGTTYPVTWQTEAGTVYGGTLDIVSGVLTVDMAIETLDGTESWTATSGYFIRKIAEYGECVQDSAICSHLPENPNISSNNSQTGFRVYNRSTSPNGTALLFRFDENKQQTTEEFTTYLADQYANGTPVQVVWELATPVTYQLDPQTVQMLKGANNLWNDAGDSTLTYVGTEEGE